jgi:hypothetical protein
MLLFNQGCCCYSESTFQFYASRRFCAEKLNPMHSSGCSSVKQHRSGLLVLIGCILLTKSLSCNVVVFIGMPYILESSKYLEFISLRWKDPYYDKFQCHKLQEGYFNVQWRFCADSNSEKLDPLFLLKRPSKASERSSVSNICPDDVAIPSRRPSVSRSFEQFKVTSVCTSLQHVRTLISVRQEIRFPSQTQIWEDSCICPDDRATPSGRYPW